MAEILTCEQMRALERAAMDSGATTGLELMERAGRGVVAAIAEAWPRMAQTPQRAVVLCGPGNNGGDGFVVARLLAERGWSISLWLFGDPARLPPDARANYDRWAAIGAVQGWDAARIADERGDLFIDAVFGTGLTRPPPDEVLEPLTMLFTCGRSADCSLAIDAPSGLDLDTGRALNPCYGVAPVALTVTFHAPKLGHFLEEAPDYCGDLRVVDIGLSPWAQTSGAEGTSPRNQDMRRVDPPVGLGKWAGHKYDYGHALILSGPSGRGGAARLAARGALRVGAGLVTLGCPQQALPEHAARLDAIMLRAVDDAAALAQVLGDARLNALALGPGLGGERARDLVPVALAAGRATVLDADALTAFAGAPAPLFDALHGGCVLTPHAGEFARLFPDLDLGDPLAAVRAAAARSGAVVLLKGRATLIAAPDGRARLHAAAYDQATPWLATAGSGDVLAGIIAGLLARDFEPLEAAASGAWLHAAAARRFGSGLIAEDIPEQLPAVFRDLGL